MGLELTTDGYAPSMSQTRYPLLPPVPRRLIYNVTNLLQLAHIGYYTVNILFQRNQRRRRKVGIISLDVNLLSFNKTQYLFYLPGRSDFITSETQLYI